MTSRLLLWTAFVLLVPAVTSALELGMNVYGLSYHSDSADSSGNKFHGWNPGAGIQLIITERGRSGWLLDGGIYRNSSSNAAKYAGLGYRFKIAHGLAIGAALSVFQSPDNNDGAAFVAPFAVISYRYKRVAVHLVPLPRYKDANKNAAIGVYGTIFFHKR